MQYCSDELVVALSIYIAASLAYQPRSPRQIAAAIPGVERSQIPRFYGYLTVLTDREALIDEGTMSCLREKFNAEARALRFAAYLTNGFDGSGSVDRCEDEE